ncbi:MAG: methyltransferase domain-containing protein [Bacteroidetes bacterium]|jgi:tocopherol O-methyltransferase|nr:methyltransferase domain-containing protein [Bacteroidota bacterium]
MITPRRLIQSRDVARHYDELDVFYREIWGEHVHHGLWLSGDESPEEAALQLVERVAQAANIHTGDAVCDVGCGYGATARWLATTYQAQATGVTLSPHQHRFAQAQPVSADAPVPTYLVQDWLQTALPPSSFDTVLFIESLAHMKDKLGALRRACRVLRPGGRLAACVWLAAPDASAWERRFLLGPICREGQLPSLPTALAYRRWMAEAGFERVRYDDISTNVQRTWTVVIGRVLRALVRRPHYRRYLLDHAQANRGFALTLLRLWIAFRTGAFRYGLLSARVPG